VQLVGLAQNRVVDDYIDNENDQDTNCLEAKLHLVSVPSCVVILVRCESKEYHRDQQEQ
jgi:hypothetical protein